MKLVGLLGYYDWTDIIDLLKEEAERRLFKMAAGYRKVLKQMQAFGELPVHVVTMVF